MARNLPWSREELILALELYFRVGLADEQHPDVVELSRLLNRVPFHASRPDPLRFRNPNGVAMKLANFASLDPAHPGVALRRGGRGDLEVWNEFAGDRERLKRAAAEIRAQAAVGERGPEPASWSTAAYRPRLELAAVRRSRSASSSAAGRAGNRAGARDQGLSTRACPPGVSAKRQGASVPAKPGSPVQRELSRRKSWERSPTPG